MRGIGGPLLCIGDLLSDVGEEGDAAVVVSPVAEYRRHEKPPASTCRLDLEGDSHVPDLTKLFQENYDHLVSALAGTDHSWTSLTLKLCTALETANHLVQSTSTNVTSLSEKVGELQKIVKRADSAIAAAREVHAVMDNNNGTMGGSSRVFVAMCSLHHYVEYLVGGHSAYIQLQIFGQASFMGYNSMFGINMVNQKRQTNLPYYKIINDLKKNLKI
ncbi:hypothetical protein Ahy_B08g089643 isoform A [Arachis hypogaea]|uniref:Uncharacterized protein n=1 Tax=Arachis hypogaea TaxID=3818 RepID=A0A444XYE7_ARAHY|nr:hypothetical protein Ahy_B08g089643 isoform A [Arachis hypogaea]